MIFARRSRSASACRAIARCIPAGISTSFTSTIETLMPHGAVDSSTIPCSYSRATLIAEIRNNTTRNRTTTTATRAAVMSGLSHRQLEPVHRYDLNAVARHELTAVRAPRAPQLAGDEHLPRRTHDTV